MVGLFDFIIGLAIGKAEWISGKIAVSFFERILKKELISFFRYWTAEDGF